MVVAEAITIDYQAISGLAVNLDAQTPGIFTLSTGSDISQWNNQGNAGAGHAIQATGSAQPLYVADGINGYPAVQFYDDDTAKHLAIADSAALDFTATGFTYFTVQRLETDLGVMVPHCKWTATGNQREFQNRISGTDKNVTFYSTNGTAETGPSTTESIVLDTPSILSGYWDSSNTVGTRINLNAPVESTGITTIFNGTSPYYIGAHSAGTSPYAGWIGQILFYNRILSYGERTQIILALSKRWGIAV